MIINQNVKEVFNSIYVFDTDNRIEIVYRAVS